MRKDKQKAINLRKAGKSYQKIHEALRIPKSTLSHWLAGEDWSTKIRNRLADKTRSKNAVHIVHLNKVRGDNLVKVYEAAREEAREEFKTLKYDPVFIAGVMLYWSDGAKDPKQGVKFATGDPKMIKFYIQFLIRSCQIPIDRIKASLVLYPELEEKVTRAYWAKMTGLPWENFTKSTVLTGRTAKRRLGWGVCTISVSSLYFKQKMLEWIQLLPEELLGSAYYENI